MAAACSGHPEDLNEPEDNFMGENLDEEMQRRKTKIQRRPTSQYMHSRQKAYREPNQQRRDSSHQQRQDKEQRHGRIVMGSGDASQVEKSPEKEVISMARKVSEHKETIKRR